MKENELIKNKKLYEVISNKVNIEKIPTLGICLGLQIMADKSYELRTYRLFLIQGKVIKLPTINKKVNYLILDGNQLVSTINHFLKE